MLIRGTDQRCKTIVYDKTVKTRKDYEAALQRCYDLIQKNIKSTTPDADDKENSKVF